jgi:Tfp pilus assembly ATPase PilU
MDGMQHFDGEIEALVRSGAVSLSTALLNATNAGNLRLQLSDYREVDEEESPVVEEAPATESRIITGADQYQ